MTWLTWRQHRGEALALAVLVAATGVALVVLGLPMHRLFPLGANHCAVPPLDQDCRFGITRLRQDYGYTQPLLILLNLVPFAIGAFLGAPLVAREMESGTWQLAWTQGVPRMRWLAVKLATLAALSVLLGAVFAAVIGWYRQPLALFGRFEIDGFDVSGLVPAAYALFAFALSCAWGAILRRSLPAVAASLVAFVAVRITVAGWLRPHYRAPITVVQAVQAGSGEVIPGTADGRDWTLGAGLVDSNGRHLSDLAAAILDHQARDAGTDTGTYLHDRGFRTWVTYQPADRFWSFQLVEAAIFVALSMILLALVVVRVRRRSW